MDQVAVVREALLVAGEEIDLDRLAGKERTASEVA